MDFCIAARAQWTMVDDDYRSLEFPFEPVEGTEHTGPFEFEAKHSMDLDAYLIYIQSWSAYQIAQQEGFELLREEVVEDFKHAYEGEDEKHNIEEAKFHVFLRIGKEGNEWKFRCHKGSKFNQIKALFLSKLMIEISL